MVGACEGPGPKTDGLGGDGDEGFELRKGLVLQIKGFRLSAILDSTNFANPIAPTRL